MTETLVQWFVQNLGGSAAKELIIFIISMIPILELRGGLLAAGPAFLNVPIIGAAIVGVALAIAFYQRAERDTELAAHASADAFIGEDE